MHYSRQEVTFSCLVFVGFLLSGVCEYAGVFLLIIGLLGFIFSL